jgi:Integrase core domain
VESFGSRLRDELLAVEAFTTLMEARVLVEDWRIEYNTVRPPGVRSVSLIQGGFTRELGKHCWVGRHPPPTQVRHLGE